VRNPEDQALPVHGNAIEVWDIGPLRTVGGQTLGTPIHTSRGV